MKTTWKIMIAFLTSAMLLSAMPLQTIDLLFPALKVNAAEQTPPTSGYCGEKTTWTLDENGTLTITGRDMMKDFNDESVSPFSNNPAIKSVVIEKGVRSIGDYAFYGCENLTAVTIPDNLAIIGFSAFEECLSLTEIKIPDSVTQIRSNAFLKCKKLSKVKMSNSIKSIEDSTFSDCEMLSEINIPDNLESINEAAFLNCTSLADIKIPKSVKQIGSSVFWNTPWLNAKRAENPLIIINKILLDGQECQGSVVIPDGVTTICGNAFFASDLTSVTFPESVIDIGEGAFSFCRNLSKVTLPTYIRYIQNRTFYECTKLLSVTIPDTVSQIGTEAFANCKSLTSITLPRMLSFIDTGAFMNCSNLTKISLPKYVQQIGDLAFENTAWLKAQQKEDPLVIIGQNLINGSACKGEVIIPNTVKNICRSAFVGADSVTALTLPESIYFLDLDILDGCRNLSTLTIPGSIQDYNYTIPPYEQFDNLTIKGYNYTVANQLALEQNLRFESLGILKGDVYTDGCIAISDAQLALSSYVEDISGIESRLTEEQRTTADVDGDQELSIKDAQCILNYYLANIIAKKYISWEDLYA